MRFLSSIFDKNRNWVGEMKALEGTDFFKNQSNGQNPKFLWIGCSDSRVPAEQIMGLKSGEIFVHRNIANLIHTDDINCQAVIEYAIEHLGIEEIIVCGHYCCGGIASAMTDNAEGLVGYWTWSIRRTISTYDTFLQKLDEENRYRAICELNVIEQVKRISESMPLLKAWGHERNIHIHGWIYGVHDGLLRDLEVCLDRRDKPAEIISNGIKELKKRYCLDG